MRKTLHQTNQKLTNISKSDVNDYINDYLMGTDDVSILSLALKVKVKCFYCCTKVKVEHNLVLRDRLTARQDYIVGICMYCRNYNIVFVFTSDCRLHKRHSVIDVSR